MKFIVTTSTRPTDKQIVEAKEIADKLLIPFLFREKRSAVSLMEQYQTGIIIVGTNKLLVHTSPSAPPFFFHPNAAMLRAKLWMSRGKDAFIEACQLKQGDNVYDATLGLASDSIVASLVVGDTGRVIGTEVSPVLAYVVAKGLQSYHTNVETIDNAMRRIEVVNSSHLQWLKLAEDNSMDVVYFDPMFEEAVRGSNGFDLMRPLTTAHQPITVDTIVEAKRVARNRVVLKDHFRSQRFREFGFQVEVRPSATYHFGIIELNKE